MENPNRENDEILAGETGEANLRNLSALLDDDVIDYDDDPVSLVVRKLNRNPPPRFAQLPEDERINQLRKLVMEYTKSDEEKKRDQMSVSINLNYVPGSAIYKAKPTAFLSDSFLWALRANSPEAIVNELPADDFTIDGVYKFKLMPREQCRMLSMEIQKFNTWCTTNSCVTDPPSIYGKAIVLTYVGLRTIVENLVKSMEPIIKVHFGVADEIDSQLSFSCFSVTFGLEDSDHQRIEPNFGDDSDITIKVCLCDLDSSGAELVFGDRLCVVHETLREEPVAELRMDIGDAVLHYGRHMNGFTPIQKYTKEYLIIWCKSPVLALTNRLKSSKWCTICKQLKQEELKIFESGMDDLIISSARGGPSGAKKQKLH